MRGSGHPRDSTAVEGECGLSRQPAGRSGDAAARQSQPVRVLTGGAGHIGKERHVGFEFCRPKRLCRFRADRTTILESDDERADGHFARVQSVEAMRRCRHYAGADFWKERERLRERDSGESFFRGGGLTADTRRMPGVRRVPSEVFTVTGSMDWRGTTLECSSTATFTDCCR